MGIFSFEIQAISKLSEEQKEKFKDKMICWSCERLVSSLDEEWYAMSIKIKGSPTVLKAVFLCGECREKFGKLFDSRMKK